MEENYVGSVFNGPKYTVEQVRCMEEEDAAMLRVKLPQARWKRCRAAFHTRDNWWCHDRNSLKADFKYVQGFVGHLDLWPPTSNQLICESKWTFKFEEIPSRHSLALVFTSQENFFWGHSNFILWPPKSNQFILTPTWTFVPNLKKFSQSILKISCSQERDSWTDHPVNIRPPATGCHQHMGIRSYTRGKVM